jgi:hypothetical protein
LTGASTAGLEKDAMIFRLSQKLNAKVKAETLGPLPLHENPLVDWSAHLFIAERTQYVLLSNTASLYSVVLYGKGITDTSSFIERALNCLRESLTAAEQEHVYAQYVAPHTGVVLFAKALDRSVTGSMTEMIYEAKFWLADGGVSLQEVGNRLNDTLLSALGQNNRIGYGKPREAFQALGERAGG